MNAHAIPSLIRRGYPPTRDRHPWPLQYRRVASLNRIQKNQGAEQIFNVWTQIAVRAALCVQYKAPAIPPIPSSTKTNKKWSLALIFRHSVSIVGRIFSAFRALGFWMRPRVLPRDFLQKSKCLYTWFPGIWVLEGCPACYPGKFFWNLDAFRRNFPAYFFLKAARRVTPGFFFLI